MLEMSYKLRLAQLFEDEYTSAIRPDGSAKRSDTLSGAPSTSEGVYPSNTTNSRIVIRATSKFDNMINYRISFGVVYLSLIHRSDYPQIMFMDYGIDCNMFFKEVARRLINREYVINDYSYRLHPVSPESKSVASGSFDGVSKTSNNGGNPPGWKLETSYASSFAQCRSRHLFIDEPILVGYHSRSKESGFLDSRGDLD